MMQLKTIGTVERGDGQHRLLIEREFRPGLMRLSDFSHVIVLWWADPAHGSSADESRTLQCNPPYAEQVRVGVFACRSPFRPNPVMVSVCPLIGCDPENGVVNIGEIDAIEGSRILDLKAYFPVCDRVREARYPDWLAGWPEWMPDNGIGIM